MSLKERIQQIEAKNEAERKRRSLLESYNAKKEDKLNSDNSENEDSGSV